jgi:cell division protein FtsB
MADDLAAVNEALTRARKRVDVLEMEKAHALKRFTEQDARIRQLRTENEELKAKVKELNKLHG